MADERGNGTGKHRLGATPIPVDLVSAAPPSSPPSARKAGAPTKSDPPEEKFQKRLQWVKWLGGVVVAIFLAGFAVAQYLTAFARSEDVRADAAHYRETHDAAHADLDRRISTIETRTVEIRIEQARTAERQRLLDARIELLLERTRGGRRLGERRLGEREEELQAQIQAQERRVRHVEEDPTAGLDDVPPLPRGP